MRDEMTRFIVMIPYFDRAFGVVGIWLGKATGTTTEEITSRMETFMELSRRAHEAHIVEVEQMRTDGADVDPEEFGFVMGEPVICPEKDLAGMAIELPGPGQQSFIRARDASQP